MKHYIVALTLSSIISATFAQASIEPLSRVVSRINRTTPDPSEIAYLGTRCGALYNMIAGYFESNGTAADTPTVNTMKRGAEDFNFVGLTLNVTVNKMSDEAILNQGKSLSEYYAKLMSEGKRMNNNALTPVVLADFSVCKNELSGFSDAAKRAKSR